MTFAIRYSLSGVAIADLLILISLHCGVPNLCKTTINTFKKLFHNISAPVTKQKYCSYCLLLIEDEAVANCRNTFRNKELKSAGATSYFLTMNI